MAMQQIAPWLLLWMSLLSWMGNSSMEAGSVITVTTVANSGQGSLRQALVNASAGDTIQFDPEIFDPLASATISLRSTLPPVESGNLLIDACNVNVIVDGSQISGAAHGIILASDQNEIRGLVIQSFPGAGIVVTDDANENTIGGDRYVGSGPSGCGNVIIDNGADGIDVQGDRNLLLGNDIGIETTPWDAGNYKNGIAIWNGAKENTVGGTSAGTLNIIGNNKENGVWIDGLETSQNLVVGNYIGVALNGTRHEANGYSGVAIRGGASNNRIGGAAPGEGNLISGNRDNGILIADDGTNSNAIYGNLIGTDASGLSVIGQGTHGISIVDGASNNRIGDGLKGGRNVIGGSDYDGVFISGDRTSENLVLGNYIGTAKNGDQAVANGLHGVEITGGASRNRIAEKNVISGNLNHGLVISKNANQNIVRGNIIGPNASGSRFLGNHPFGAIDITDGASANIIGGLEEGEGNIISGNPTDAIALFSNVGGADTADNQILGNLIGVADSKELPLPNQGPGILNTYGAVRTRIEQNTIAFNEGAGIFVADCLDVTITANSIHSNDSLPIHNLVDCVGFPEIDNVQLGEAHTIVGRTSPNATVEFFSSDRDDAKSFEGSTVAGPDGSFIFSIQDGFVGPNVTLVTIETNGNTSSLSPPIHIDWTILLYLNGDNDLEEYVNDVVNSLSDGSGSPGANVLALVDYLDDGSDGTTRLLDLTYGRAEIVDILTGEKDMGDPATLIDFVVNGSDYYPSKHIMVSMLDHGGGWAPSPIEDFFGALPRTRAWTAGASGLSWDFSNNYNYMNSREIQEAFDTIRIEIGKPLDVVFFDVCLMGLIEVAHQISADASYIISSQNLGWAPAGNDNRYSSALFSLDGPVTPREMSAIWVNAYAEAMPNSGHPYTIAAVDTARLDEVASLLADLRTSLQATITQVDDLRPLYAAYQQSQKFDYDADFVIEETSDGFVDLYDFALELTKEYPGSNIASTSNNLITLLDEVLVGERHFSDVPWVSVLSNSDIGDDKWDFENANGLSIYLPLGEDLIYFIETEHEQGEETKPAIFYLRNLYSEQELSFVDDTGWDELIQDYYQLAPTTVVTAAGGITLQKPDVVSPTTTITVTGELKTGESINIEWSSTDQESGLKMVSLLKQNRITQEWKVIDDQAADGPSTTGSLQIELANEDTCSLKISAAAVDMVGNTELTGSGRNIAELQVLPCEQVFLPFVFR